MPEVVVSVKYGGTKEPEPRIYSIIYFLNMGGGILIRTARSLRDRLPHENTR